MSYLGLFWYLKYGIRGLNKLVSGGKFQVSPNCYPKYEVNHILAKH